MLGVRATSEVVAVVTGQRIFNVASYNVTILFSVEHRIYIIKMLLNL